MTSKSRLNIEVGERLRTAIKRHPEFGQRGGLGKLAKLVGCKQAARISEYCSGEKTIPVDKMHAFSEHLGVNIHWLVTGQGEMRGNGPGGQDIESLVPLVTSPAQAWAVITGDQSGVELVEYHSSRKPEMLYVYNRTDMQPGIPAGSTLSVAPRNPCDGEVAIAIGDRGAYVFVGVYSAATQTLTTSSGGLSYSIRDKDILRAVTGVGKEF